MADSVAERQDGRRPDRSEDADASLDELRSLIVGPEQRELLALQAQLDRGPVQARDVSRVLPESIALRGTDPQLTRALGPFVEDAITTSVRRNPRPLADALFPVMGPAIRKAIAHTLASMMVSLNRTVEHSVSWRALQWRWTALRTGTKFAEVVLLNTLQYRVEQVYLIHRETGLLLQHVSIGLPDTEDADQISAMLTAIRDFARDSFHVSGEDELDALRIGELSVYVEQGPQAIVAGIVRGTPPPDLRAAFQEAVEAVHLQLGPALESFEGDAAPFERARPILQACLVTQFRPAERPASGRRWIAALAIVVVAAGVWIAIGLRDRQRWNAYLDRLRAEPGIVVLTSGRRAGKYFVMGLRDPLAGDPAAMAASSSLPAGSIQQRWEPYQGILPPFVTSRARDLLRPPPGVTLAFADGVLTAAGPAPGRWILDSERLAPAIAGVRRFEYSGKTPETQLAEALEAASIRFAKGQSRMIPGQEDALRSLARTLIELNETMRARSRRARIEVLGHTDADGSASMNGSLGQARADALRQALGAPLLDRLEFSSRSVGSTMPLTTGATEIDKERNRRASLHVVPSDEDASGSPR